jgi:hypothetical protein
MFEPKVYRFDFTKDKPQLPTTPTTTPTATTFDQDALARQIQEGYRKYSGGQEVPMEQYIPLMVAAAQKYPIFKENPMLLPATSIVETSAGQNWKLNNNPLSWAARIQQAGGYSPTSPEQSINDMITAVGGDQNRGAGYDPETAASRLQTMRYYDKFRNSKNLKDFAETYDGGNDKYYPALIEALKHFQTQ